jgi:hypothetical protein
MDAIGYTNDYPTACRGGSPGGRLLRRECQPRLRRSSLYGSSLWGRTGLLYRGVEPELPSYRTWGVSAGRLSLCLCSDTVSNGYRNADSDFYSDAYCYDNTNSYGDTYVQRVYHRCRLRCLGWMYGLRVWTRWYVLHVLSLRRRLLDIHAMYACNANANSRTYVDPGAYRNTSSDEYTSSNTAMRELCIYYSCI